MKKRHSQRMQIALILALGAMMALGSFWFLEVMRRDADNTSSPIPKNEADYVVEKFNFVRMSTTGQPRYNISGATLTHYPNGDTFQITQPVLHNLADTEAPMVMRAERAEVDHVNNKIHLRDKVKIDRPATASGKEFHMRTEYLQILPDEDIVKTDQAVEMDQGRSKISAVGMVLNNVTHEYQFLSKVHATILPVTQ